MVAVKMFIEMWRNLTSATTNWSFSSSGGSSRSGSGSSGKGSGRPARYNRLRSGPTKSQSQPANLISFATGESPSSSSSSSSSSESLTQRNLSSRGETTSFSVQQQQHEDASKGKMGNFGMKHSFSSTFPTTVSSVIATATTPFSPQSRVQTTLGPPIPTERIDNGQFQRSPWNCANNNNNNYNIPDEYISDLDEEVEHLTCDVCDRAFSTLKQLADHQRKKRHYGCLQCDSIFPSREILEIHREQMLHFDYPIPYDDNEDDLNSDDSFETDDDENGLIDSDDCDDEERERLL